MTYRMPVDHITATLKPASFFKVNPSMDVPGIHDNLSTTIQPGQNDSSCH